mgnify:CR=1 FL=1
MKFKSGTRRKALEYEKDLVEHWKREKTFEKSVKQRPVENGYVFYDGPPFITGVPHHGTLLSSIVKDAVPRYQTMNGRRVERVWGWDCHGLPAEVYTEKKLGITDKKDIGTKISLEDYIKACRENMVLTGSLWEDTISRVGRWVDFQGAYKTMDKEYMESVWWAFKELFDKGKIYEGEKVLMYCTHDATPLAKAEIAMDNSYQDVTDPSVYVKFKLVDSDAHLLAWTTTPWTLNANTGLAINKNVEYAEVELDDQKLILAKDLLEKALTNEKHQVLPYKLLRTFKGEELIGKSYEPLFVDRGDNAHKIWDAWFIHTDNGTGIAHQAPAYGEEDYQLSREMKFPMVLDTDDEGYYTEGDWKGQQIWEVNKEIAKTLLERGVVWKIEYIKHSYPHCHRCGTKLMYRAVPSWFLNVADQRDQMLEQNENINWFPGHIKHGRFENTVKSAPDWNLSRDRFWATAMPVWKGVDGDGNEHVKVVGSYAELKDLSGKELEDYHRPWIDDVTFTIDNIEYKRVDKVMDSWFEAGSMPFAQFHYPFENKEKFESSFPGHFIAEYVGQVRAWFYYLHTVSVGLQGTNSYKNVIVTGTLAGNDGRKMSKSYGNFTDPNELMDTYSADALRFLLLSSPLLNGEDFSLVDKDVSDVARKLSMIWNMYDFFTMYAEVDGWEYDSEKSLSFDPDDLTNPLDKWIVSRVHQLNEHVTKHMDSYNIPVAMSEFLPFVEDASNWFVRRSRRRFWKSEDDGDKKDAYRTLHYILMRLAVVMAPFTPFLSEELYQKLGGNNESVHLLDWPVNNPVDQVVVTEMVKVREYVNQALSLRATERIKIRQPLASVTVPSLGEKVSFEDVLMEELNVKKVIQGQVLSLDFEITPVLKREGLMREVIRYVQKARKDAGLNVDDRIKLHVGTDDNLLRQSIAEHSKTILDETLAVELVDHTFEYQSISQVESVDLIVSLEKA